MKLIGRDIESAAVRQLLTNAREGRSGVLVIRGEPGIGKSALLEAGREEARSSGFEIAQVTGVESEARFAHAALHRFVGPLMGRAPALAEPQQEALAIALGLLDGPAPDRFLVALGVLNLLAAAAEDRPVLCTIDDAQWLDEVSAHVLSFVSRRLSAERIALLCAVRDPPATDTSMFEGLPEVSLTGLDEASAGALLDASVAVPLVGGVRERLIAEARGNPLALLELPRQADSTRLAEGLFVLEASDAPGRVEETFMLRFSALPPDTRLLLLVAAADTTGDASLLWRAIDQLGVRPESADAAETAGLLEIGSDVRFRHPLVRSSVYRASPPADRRSAHRALADATDANSDPDRQAWHRALSVTGTDENAAAELERAAQRAQARGETAAAAAFLQRSAELTSDAAQRSVRAMGAAEAKLRAGAPDAAMRLLTIARAGPLDDADRGRSVLIDARIAFHRSRRGNVPGMLAQAAGRLATTDSAFARVAYLHALDAAIILGDARVVREIADAACSVPAPAGVRRPADLLLDGLATSFADGYAPSVPLVRQALEAFRTGADSDVDSREWLWRASRTAVAVFDDDLADELGVRNIRLARRHGDLAVLPAAQLFRSALLVLEGDFAGSEQLAGEGLAISRAVGALPLRHAQLFLAAWRGDIADTLDLHASILREAVARERGTEVYLAHYALAVLRNGAGDHRAALEVAVAAGESDEWPHLSLILPELIEAAVRSNELEQAERGFRVLESRARAAGTDWALGLAASARALTGHAPSVDRAFVEAIERLGRTRITAHLARVQLLYGEWLRREGRRRDARELLRAAHDLFSTMGAHGFAERAARELRAIGDQPRVYGDRPLDALTAQEVNVARLVIAGATSREVGEQLFLSTRTIETHLRNIYRKLGIGSRRELRQIPLDGTAISGSRTR
nr:LuxR family transcriptional regulator [Microbacterium sp. UBA3394]